MPVRIMPVRTTRVRPLMLLLLCLPALLPPREAMSADMDAAEAAARTAFARLHEAERLPGALIGIALPGAPVLRLALGEANVETGAPMRLDHTMRIGSVQKLIVATAALQLAERGLLDLDAPIACHVPGVPNGAAITLRMLGNHTSGLFNPLADARFRARINAAPSAELARDDILAVAFANPVAHPPGTGFTYSNANTILLGAAIEAATGRALPDVLADTVLRPLGADGALVPASWRLPDPELRGYRHGPRAGAIEYGRIFFDATAFSASWAGAAGNMNATLDDLLKLAKPLASGATLGPAGRAELEKAVPESGPLRYGFGLARFGAARGHAGDVPGFSSFLAWLPATDAVVVVLANLSNTRDKRAPATLIGRAVLDALEPPA